MRLPIRRMLADGALAVAIAVFLLLVFWATGALAGGGPDDIQIKLIMPPEDNTIEWIVALGTGLAGLSAVAGVIWRRRR